MVLMLSVFVSFHSSFNEISSDHSRTLSTRYTLLPSGRRYSSLLLRTKRATFSFLPTSIGMLNNKLTNSCFTLFFTPPEPTLVLVWQIKRLRHFLRYVIKHFITFLFLSRLCRKVIRKHSMVEIVEPHAGLLAVSSLLNGLYLHVSGKGQRQIDPVGGAKTWLGMLSLVSVPCQNIAKLISTSGFLSIFQ